MRFPNVFLFFLSVTISYGQTVFDELIQEALIRPDYSFTYKKISVDWKMEGSLQFHFNNGLNNLFEAKFAQAAGEFDDALKVNSNFWQAYYYRGICYKMMRDFRAAEDDFHAIEKINPDFYETNIELAKNYILENDLVNAEEHLSRCSKIDPARAEGPYLTAYLYFIKKDLENAKENYLLTLEKDSTFYAAQIRIGIIRAIQKNNPYAALPALTNVLERDSTNVEASLFRCLFTLNNDPPSSLKDINRVILQAPTAPLYRYVRCLLYVTLKDFDKAFSDLRNVMRNIQTDENTFKGKQTTLDKRIDLQYAGAYVISKIYGLPEQEAQIVRKAFCQLALGHSADCTNTLLLLPDFNKSALAFYLTGVAAEHQGNHARAWGNYANALKYDNDILDAHKKIGIYHSNRHQLAEAEKEFTEALRLNPELTVLNNLRGVTRFNRGDFEGAIGDFSKCIQKDTMDFVAITNRKGAYEKLNDQSNVRKDEEKLNALRASRSKRIQNTVDEIVKKRDTTSALKSLDTYTAATKSIAAYIIKIKILMDRKDWVRVYYEANFAMDNLNPSFYFKDENSFLAYVLGLYYLSIKRLDYAETQFDLAVKIDNRNALAYLERGRIADVRGQKNVAKENFKKAAELGSGEAKKLVRSK